MEADGKKYNRILKTYDKNKLYVYKLKWYYFHKLYLKLNK